MLVMRKIHPVLQSVSCSETSVMPRTAAGEYFMGKEWPIASLRWTMEGRSNGARHKPHPPIASTASSETYPSCCMWSKEGSMQ